MKGARQHWIWIAAMIAAATWVVGWMLWDPREAMVRQAIAEQVARMSSSSMTRPRVAHVSPAGEASAGSFSVELLPRLVEEAVRGASWVERWKRFLCIHAPKLFPRTFRHAASDRQTAALALVLEHPRNDNALAHLLKIWPRIPHDCLWDASMLLDSLTPIGDRTALPVILGLARDTDPWLRQRAVPGLAKLAGREKAARAALDELEKDQVATVREAVEALSAH